MSQPDPCTVAPAATGTRRPLPLPRAVVELAGVTKRYGSRTILDRVDLSIPAGRVTAILGPNAAGKSTLIKLILGLVRPDAGAITVNGTGLDGDATYRHHIGYMPQAARFPDNLTGREVLEMVRDVRGRPLTTDDYLIRRFDIADDLDRPVRVLSGGTRQKLNAVIALLFRPSLLVLDEPTAGLDPISSGIFKDKIREAREEGTSIVLTSHVLSEVEELADVVVFLLDGSIHFDGTRQALWELTGKASLERAIASLMTRLKP